MRYKSLKIGESIYTQDRVCDSKLNILGFNWLVESEFEEADIEIIKDTILWKSGNFYSGIWHYGIIESGIFNGIFKNGIISDGVKFGGKFISGIKI